MRRTVLTFLIGLMLSLSGGASALTFKSDGSVVQKDGRIIQGPKTQNTPSKPVKSFSDAIDDLSDKELCNYAAVDEPKRWSFFFPEHVETAKIRGLKCGVRETTVASSNSNEISDKTQSILVKNRELLKATEIYGLVMKGSTSSSKERDEKWSVMVMHDQLIAFYVHAKGRKFVFGRQFAGTPLRLEGYEYDQQKNLFARIALPGGWDASFIDYIASGKRFKGHINWPGDSRKTIELVSANTITDIEKNNSFKINILEVSNPKEAFKLVSSRLRKLKRYRQQAIDLENFLKSKAITDLPAGKDISPLISQLEELKMQLKALSEAEALRLVKLEEERKAKEAEARRLAKLEEERKAKQAEARRLAKLAEERKAKEAEARRLAKLEKERKAKEAEARRLAKLEEERKAKEAEARRLAQADNSPPKIFAEVVNQDGYDALVRGVITDDTGLQDIAMNGQLLDLDDFGVFEESIYIPRGGKLVTIEAMDKLGKLARFELKLERQELAKLKLASFAELTPSKRIAYSNDNAVAIVIGIAQYQRTEVPAIYADQDANYFYDYAALKLGVPERNIIDLVNENANAVEIFLATENFLRRKIQKDVTDVYIFYAGHGLATDDGSEMYLLPYDGAPQLLERTAISRKQLFNDIAASNPKSVTVFLDTCYSGTTRGTETLIASRPIAITAKQQDIPEGFTVMTAAAGDQTAKPLEEAKHGMFSYFLMKGMEGDADANQDNQITAGELHAYVQQNVIQQSSGSQTPELQGDADRVLVRF